MTIDDRHRDALSSVDPEVTASPAAWASITRRTTRRIRTVRRARRAGPRPRPGDGRNYGPASSTATTGGQHVSTAGTPAPPPSAPSSSADTATTATTSPASGVALQRVDWSRAAALDCGSTDQGPVATTVVQVAYPSPAPDKTVAVVLVRCDAGAGTPPTSVLVFDQATSTTAAHLLGR